MTLEKKLLWLLLPLAAAFSSIARVWKVMPAVMQDEYVYSIQARYTPFAEQLYPNYLFSWIYNNTLQCGDGFYQCAKSYNAVFFLITLAFVFLIAQKLLSFSWAIAVSTLTAISSISVYVSYFMPESMYFAFITAAVWLTLKAGQNPKLHMWLIAGSMLGLAALVKPHALFSLLAILLFALLVSLRSEAGKAVKANISTLAAAAGFLATKFAIGFAFAGVNGLTLFGSAYTSSIPAVNSGIPNKVQNVDLVAQTVSNASVGQIFAAESSPQSFFEILFTHIPAHISLVMLVGGIPILLSFGVLAGAITKKREISQASQYQLLIGALAFTVPLIMAAFEAFITTTGDDHTHRLITRHYEFLFPLLLIAGANFLKFVEPSLKGRFVQAVVAIACSLIAIIYVAGTVKWDYADSILLSGFINSGWLVPTLSLASIAISFVWLFNKESGAKALAYGLIPATALFGGISGQLSLHDRVGTEPAFFDTAGQVAKNVLVGIPGEKISVIGQANYLNTTTKFWIDKPNIKDTVLADGAVAQIENFADVDYVVLIGNSSITGDNVVLTEGEGYAVVQLGH